MDLSRRVRAVCDLDVAEMREYSGRHEYDGKPQDLSTAGVRAGLARLAQARATGERVADAHDEAQLSEARRASFDPTYGRYTWGKLVLLKLRERARKDWGAGFSLQRFHRALLDLGSPALGLLGTAVDRG